MVETRSTQTQLNNNDKKLLIETETTVNELRIAVAVLDQMKVGLQRVNFLLKILVVI